MDLENLYLLPGDSFTWLRKGTQLIYVTSEVPAFVSLKLYPDMEFEGIPSKEKED